MKIPTAAANGSKYHQKTFLIKGSVLTFDIFQPSPRLDVLNAIREDRTPNLLLMRYALATWEVRDLLLIPSFMFSESAVIKRKPLAATARRVHPPQYLLRRTGRLGGLQYPVKNTGQVAHCTASRPKPASPSSRQWQSVEQASCLFLFPKPMPHAENTGRRPVPH